MKRIKLGEIIERLIHGGTPSLANESFWIGNIPWITGADFVNQKVVNIRRYISAKALKFTATNLIAEGDLLLVTRTGVGKMAIAPCDIAISQDITGITFDQNAADTEFMYYLLQGKTDHFLALNQGTSINGITREDLLNLEIEIPSKQEQIKIVDVLCKVDRAIEQTESLIAKYQRIKTGLMHDLLTRGIDEHGRLRNPATHKFKPSPLGRIPEEWSTPELGGQLKEIEQGWSPDCEDEPAVIGEWGVLKTTSVVWGGFDSCENKRLPKNLTPKRHLEIKIDDVLMTRAGPNSRVGVVAYARATQEKLLLSDKIYRLVPKSNLVPEFLSLTLSGYAYQIQLSRMKTGMAESQTNISQEIVQCLRIPLPDKEEQMRIVNPLRLTTGLVNIQTTLLAKLKYLRTGLMQDLLTGKVSVEPLLAAD